MESWVIEGQMDSVTGQICIESLRKTHGKGPLAGRRTQTQESQEPSPGGNAQFWGGSAGISLSCALCTDENLIIN